MWMMVADGLYACHSGYAAPQVKADLSLAALSVRNVLRPNTAQPPSVEHSQYVDQDSFCNRIVFSVCILKPVPDVEL